MNREPLISIIMPTFNRGAFIEAALQNLIEEKRTYPNLEIIVVDGGSRDSTLEVLKKYSADIDAWISEPDKGPAEAFNKGVKKAKGEIVRFASDDDRLIRGHTRAMADYMTKHPEIDILGAGAEHFFLHPDGNMTPQNFPNMKGDVRLEKFARHGETGFLMIETCHIRRKLFDEIGFWDESYRITCDFEFLLRTLRRGKKLYVLDLCITRKVGHADSICGKGLRRMQKEAFKCIKAHAGLRPALFYYYRYVWKPAFQEYWQKSRSLARRVTRKILRIFSKKKNG